jgi:hypothetical protein
MDQNPIAATIVENSHHNIGPWSHRPEVPEPADDGVAADLEVVDVVRTLECRLDAVVAIQPTVKMYNFIRFYDCEVRGHCMCKEMPVIPVNGVVDKKRIIGKNRCGGGGGGTRTHCCMK